jgi:hypothetical protein
MSLHDDPVGTLQRFEREPRLFLLAAEAADRITIDCKKAVTSEN